MWLFEAKRVTASVCVAKIIINIVKYADVAELADALDSKSSGKPCGFESHHRYQGQFIATAFFFYQLQFYVNCVKIDLYHFVGGITMADIVYFMLGDKGRYINRGWKAKITIGDKIFQEGYYIGEAVEKERCWIFHGTPYIPAVTDLPSYVDFDPNLYRYEIKQDSIRYFLVKHKKSGAHFVICCYLLSRRFPRHTGRYFADLLSFIDGKWRIRQWPFEADCRYADDKIREYWRKYNNYYEEDFEIIRELKGS